jgi:hypothetical protein
MNYGIFNASIKKNGSRPGMMIHICNPSTWEAEEGGL